MNWATKIAIHINLRKIGKKDIKRWIQESNIDLLKFTLRKGLYPERILAINGLAELKEKSILPELIEIAKKDFEVVATAAISAIKKLDTDLSLTNQVDRLEKFWEWKNKKHRRSPKSIKWINKKEKMQMLEKVRKQLKRPMR